MTWKDTVLGISRFIPAASAPKMKLDFNSKFKWTLMVLILYFTLTQIPVFGLSETAVDYFSYLRVVMAGEFGSIVTLGIGPLVTASIILQLLVGAKIISLNLQDPDDRKIFSGMQKLLAIVFTIFEALAFVLTGGLPPSPGFIAALGAGAYGIIVFQLFLGGLIIIFLDDIISKWGFGSGISLFIAAGVASAIFLGAFNILPAEAGLSEPAGLIPGFIYQIMSGTSGLDLMLFKTYLGPVLATLGVFIVVVYAQLIKVEVPLAFGSIRGFGRRWPLKLIYTSNIPVILTAALIANVMLLSRSLGCVQTGAESVCGLLPFMGTFDANGSTIGGVMYYLSPPNLLMSFGGDALIRALCYTLFMMAGAVLFSKFWVNTAGMDAKSVANQIKGIGMSIPGFRRDPRIVERVLNRYIPSLAVLSGAFVGLLASVADFTGALGSGTGILLAVMIVYNLYEEINNQHSEDMPPMFRRFFGKE